MGGVARSLFKKQTIDGFGFDAELLYLAKKSGYTVREVPVRWINSPNSRVNILKDPLLMLKDLIVMRKNYLIKNIDETLTALRPIWGKGQGWTLKAQR